MARGLRLEPKIDITFKVRDLTIETAPLVQEVFGKAFVEVKNAMRLNDPTRTVDASVEIANPNPTMDEMKDAMYRRALRETNGEKRAAAKLLKVSERQVHRWIADKGEEAIS